MICEQRSKRGGAYGLMTHPYLTIPIAPIVGQGQASRLQKVGGGYEFGIFYLDHNYYANSF